MFGGLPAPCVSARGRPPRFDGLDDGDGCFIDDGYWASAAFFVGGDNGVADKLVDGEERRPVT